MIYQKFKTSKICPAADLLKLFHSFLGYKLLIPLKSLVLVFMKTTIQMIVSKKRRDS